MKLLDCTLRDGGYYTNWDFDKGFVDTYIKWLDKLPIDYIEIGYRSLEQKDYFGEYFYLPLSTIKNIKSKTLTPLSIMINGKECSESDIRKLLSNLSSIVTLVRVAVDVEHLSHGINLVKEIKNLGFEVAINIMRASDLKSGDFIKYFDGAEEYLDYIYLVDSYGSMHPQELESLIRGVKSVTTAATGFHGHNNIELAFANSMKAMECGCSIVDLTVLGMGRGAGNLKTELFLTYLKRQDSLDVDLNIVGKLVESFYPLKIKYKWGTNLAYIASGTYSLPQSDVMEALDLNRYSLTTIVNNIKSKNEIQAPELKLDTVYKSCLIVGGGISVKKHQQAIRDFLNFNKNFLVIHATSKYIDEFQSISNTQFSVISGDELSKFDEIPSNIHSFILGSNSLFVDTYRDNGNFYTLNDLSFTEQNQDSPFSISLQIALNIDSKKIFLVGFDGYEELKNKKELYLMKENQQIIDSFVKKQELNSLTPTKYSHVKKSSVYEKSLLCI